LLILLHLSVPFLEVTKVKEITIFFDSLGRCRFAFDDHPVAISVK